MGWGQGLLLWAGALVYFRDFYYFRFILIVSWISLLKDPRLEKALYL